MPLKSIIRNRLSPRSRQKLRRYVTELKTIGHGSNLNKLALIYGTDKSGEHFYTQHYVRYFAPLRKKPLTILEIGVGGYSNLSEGAQSLRMWKRFFPNA